MRTHEHDADIEPNMKPPLTLDAGMVQAAIVAAFCLAVVAALVFVAMVIRGFA